MFSAFNISLPGHSKYEYNITIEKLNIMFGNKAVEQFISQDGFYSKAEFMEYFNDFYNALSFHKLDKLYAEHNMRFYLIHNKRDDLDSYHVCSGKKYFVYDLSLIKLTE